MPEDEKAGWSLVDFAKQVAGAHSTKVESDSTEPAPVSEKLIVAPAAATMGATIPYDPPSISKKQNATPGGLRNTRPAHVIESGTSGRKQLRTPDEMAKIILAALQAIDSCPDRGFVITVYGSNPWNAMLTIRPEAGTAIDRPLWTSRVQEIGVCLRDNFDIIQESSAFTDGPG
jgi:hypothetical protein